MNKFKAGDLVYCPALGSGIYKIELNENIDVISYPYKVVNETRQMMTLSHHGLSNRHHHASCVFPVSDENHALITKLYGMEFEKPKPKPTPRQVIENKLQTAKFATCLVGDRYDWDGMALIVSVKDGNDGAIEYIDGMGNSWYDAQLIDDSGCEIWE